MTTRYRDLGADPKDPKAFTDLVHMGISGWAWAQKDQVPVKVAGMSFEEAMSQAVGELVEVADVELVKSRYSDEMIRRTRVLPVRLPLNPIPKKAG